MSLPLPFLRTGDSELLDWRYTTFWEKEPETIQWLKQKLISSDTQWFLDVGANIGLYSLYAASQSASVQVLSFEPAAENLPVLRGNIQANGFGNRVSVITSPLSEFEGAGVFLSEDKREGSSGGQFIADSGTTYDPDSLIDSKTGDFWCERHKVSQAILKIDVDGADFQILKGFSQSFESGRICSVLIEGNQENGHHIEKFLGFYGFMLDSEIASFANHSDLRRIRLGKCERNLVFNAVP